jgi:predicted Zn-dependent protease with MMP-like domain
MPPMQNASQQLERQFWRRLRAAAESEVRQTLEGIPPPLRSKIRDVPIVFQRTPSPDMERDGVDPDLLGLFTGPPCNSPCDDFSAPQIHIFFENIWEDVEHDADEYREQVRVTLLHELGHYLGLEEDGLSARNLE